MELASPVFVLSAILLAALVLYALTGGADYGGGIWDLLAVGRRSRRQRALIEEALAPIWEANHVWLILVIVILFSGFPPAFAAIMTALHIPLTVILLGIVLRGCAFVFRKYDAQDDVVHRRWSTTFGVASFLTPFGFGLCLGGLASGEIRVQDGVVVSGFFAGWTSLFAVACGLFAQGLFAFLAAAYLAADAHGDPEVQEDFRRRALVAGLLLAPAAALTFFVARATAPVLYERLTDWWAPLLLVGTSVCAVGALGLLWLRRYGLARIAAAGQVGFILLGWGLAQYPYLVIPDVTLSAAATSEATIRMLLWILAVGTVILLPSFAYLFLVFKRRGEPQIGDLPLEREEH